MPKITEIALTRLLNKTRENPYNAFRASNKTLAGSRRFCGLFLDQCDALNFDSPNGALERGFVARELAQKTGNKHLYVRALGVLGTGFRTERLDSKAEYWYKEAEAWSEKCTCCLPSIYNRWGVLEFYREDYGKSFERFSDGIVALGNPPPKDGLARILVARCMALSELRRFSEAIADVRSGLMSLEEKTPQFYYISGLANLVFIVSAVVRQAGDLDLTRESLEVVRMFRVSLSEKKIKYGFERVRAHMRWSEGLLRAALGDYENRSRARQSLEVARANFLALGLIDDYRAASSDLSLLYLTGTRVDNSRQVSQIARACLEHTDGDSREAAILRSIERAPTSDNVVAFRELLPVHMPFIDIREPVAITPPLTGG